MVRLLLIAVISCATYIDMWAAVNGSLIGTWQLDTESTWNKMKEMPEVKSLPPHLANLAKKALFEEIGEMEFSISKDRIMRISGYKLYDGTYAVKPKNANVFQLESTTPEKNSPLAQAQFRVFENGIIMADPEYPKQALIFIRGKP